MRAGMERMTEAMLMQKAFLSGSSSSSCTALIDTRGSFILGQNANNDDGSPRVRSRPLRSINSGQSRARCMQVFLGFV